MQSRGREVDEGESRGHGDDATRSGDARPARNSGNAQEVRPASRFGEPALAGSPDSSFPFIAAIRIAIERNPVLHDAHFRSHSTPPGIIPPPRPLPLQPGARLGPYEIVSAVGAGGMGEVYKARDVRLDRLVAIKVRRR